MKAITWFGGHVGVIDDWTLHLLRDDVTFCGRQLTRRVTAREANSEKCRWCETCLASAQASTVGSDDPALTGADAQ